MKKYIIFILFLYLVSSCSLALKEERGGNIRSDENIMNAFNSYKGGFFKIYKNALQDNENLSGTMVFSMSVSPDGKVKKCDFNSVDSSIEEISEKVRAYILDMNFGKIDGKINSNFLYPIEFRPPPG